LKRAFIYARYSTDLQNEKSVEDQIALCKDYARRLGVAVVGNDHDRAKSGASTFGRPGLSRILEAAKNGLFNVLISEHPDRISRDMADLAGIHKALEFRGIEMNCVNTGRMDSMQIGMHGVVGQMQREEGAKKVRRGLAGVVRDGRSAGGRAYGYKSILGRPGQLEILESEAAIIRRIFGAYAVGTAPRNIAATLNKEAVPAPRGSRWNASTINGSGKRGHGILRNPLYAGNQIWNRVRMLKDPSTGRRVSRPNPPSEWQTVGMPHLRIVDQTLFDKVAVRMAAVGGEHALNAPRSKRLLSGLLKCGCCGGGMSIIGSDRSGPRIQCSVFKESGACDNAARYYIQKIERLVIDALQLQLSDPALIKEYVKTYREERNRAESEARRKRSTLDRDHAKAKVEIQRIVSSIAKGLITEDEAASLLDVARGEIARLELELGTAASHTNVIELHPQAVQRFKENVEALAEILVTKDDLPDLDLMGTFRSLVERVIVQPRKAGGEYEVSIRGYLASLMGADLSALVMVAREGLEPPTPGL
jgi:site-specific DNA recombinase